MGEKNGYFYRFQNVLKEVFLMHVHLLHFCSLPTDSNDSYWTHEAKGNKSCSTGHEAKLRQWPRLVWCAAANHQPAACNTLILCSGAVRHSNTNHSKRSLWISLTSPLTGLERDIVCGTICLTTQRYIRGDLSAGKVFFVLKHSGSMQVWDLLMLLKLR